ncbi:MAG: hypothetical protein WC280_01455 [Patescibacteria group bacterium]
MFKFESKKNNKEKEVDLREILEKEYSALGIDSETIKSNDFYKDFEKLDDGSKLIVLKNLKSIILKDVNTESNQKISDSTKGKPSKGFLSKVKRSRSFREDREQELKILADIGLDNFKEGKYEELISNLSKGVSAFEIESRETKDGKSEVVFLKVDSSCTPEEAEIIKDFNESANKFLNIPKEWAHEVTGSNKKNNELYAKALTDYAIKRNELFEVSKFKENQEDIMKTDWQVKILRDFKNDSVLEDEWNEAVKNEGFFKKIISRMSTGENMAYTGAGFATRSIAGALSLSFAALPAIMAIGAIRGSKRGKEELLKRDKNKLYKEDDKSKKEDRIAIREEIRKIVPAEFSLNPEEWLKNAKPEEVKRYKELTERLRSLDDKKKKESGVDLNVSSAEDLSVKLRTLIDSFNSTNDGKYIELLISRVDFTSRKLREELISFGDVNRIAAFLDLKSNLEEAKNLVNLFDFMSKNEDKIEKVSKRLAKLSYIKGEKIDSARHKHILIKAIKGMASAGAFYSAGSLIAELTDSSSAIEDLNIEDNTNLVTQDKVNEVLDNISKIEERVDSFESSDTVIDDFEVIPKNIVDNPEIVSENIVNESEIIPESAIENGYKGLEDVGRIEKTVTLEKGDGVSKIFDGRMNNEYKVNFVDSKTGEIETGAAFSRVVHPGDEIVLAENGEVYVICKNGINENPLYNSLEVEADTNTVSEVKAEEVSEDLEPKREYSEENIDNNEEEYLDDDEEYLEDEEEIDNYEEEVSLDVENDSEINVSVDEDDIIVDKKEDIPTNKEILIEDGGEENISTDIQENITEKEDTFDSKIDALVDDSSDIETFVDLIGEDFIKDNNLKLSAVSSDFMDYKSIEVKNAAGDSMEFCFYKDEGDFRLDINHFKNDEHLNTDRTIIRDESSVEIIKKSIEQFLVE